MIGRELRVKPSAHRFRFGDGVVRSLGQICLRIPVASAFIDLSADVVPLQVPLLIGLDVMTRYGMRVCTQTARLEGAGGEGWSVPLKVEDGHLVLRWFPQSSEILFTKLELVRMHRGFYHPASKKLYDVLRRARPSETPPHLLSVLEEISQRCETCQRISGRPIRFRATIPRDLCFGEELELDLMWIAGKPVLHITDVATRYSSAAWLDRGEGALEIWRALTLCWTTFFPGFPRTVRCDSGPQFTSQRWKELCAGVGVAITLSPIENHNAIGLNERLHGPLRRTFERIMTDVPGLPHDIALRVAVKALNDSVGPNGLIPTLMVFGTLPQLPLLQGRIGPYDGQIAREKALNAAMAEYRKYVAEQRIRLALSSRESSSMAHRYEPGDEVLVYREAERRWIGPLRVVLHEDKVITVISEVAGDGHRTQRFNIASVKPYLSPAVPASRSDDEPLPERVLLTEVLGPKDPRQFSKDFMKAKMDELEGLRRNGTWEEVWAHEMPPDANTMRGRFVLTIKDRDTAKEVLKARFVAQGFRDQAKSTLVHSAVLARQSSTRVVVSLATAFGWDVHSHDVTKAYVQGEILQREIYLVPPKELQLEPNRMLRLVKPLYGLTDSGDIWYETLITFLREQLQMVPLTGDPGLLYCVDDSGLQGVILMYVDDLLLTGTPCFLERSKCIGSRFDSRERKINAFSHTGMTVSPAFDGAAFTISQTAYVANITLLAKNCNFRDLRSLRARLLWVTNTRPDVAGAVAALVKITEEQFQGDPDHSRLAANKIVRFLRKRPLELRYKALDLSHARLVTYADAGGENHSQLGYVVTLQDRMRSCHVLAFGSRKSHRVVTGAFSGEALALAHAFDVAFTLQHDYCRLLGRKLPLCLRTDSLALFDAISKNTPPREHRLSIDLEQLRESWRRREIAQLAFIRSEQNVADSLTKANANNFARLFGGTDHAVLSQWIDRPLADSRNGSLRDGRGGSD